MAAEETHRRRVVGTAEPVLSCRRRPRTAFAVTAVVVSVLAWWGWRHTQATAWVLQGHPIRFGLLYTLAFVLLAAQVGLSMLDRPRRVTRRQQRQLDGYRVAALVPVFNEDPAALRAGLASLIRQTRMPNWIVVVDDGSTEDYGQIREWFLDQCRAVQIAGSWQRQDNAGKRMAQAAAVLATPEADVYLTVDSDAVQDPNALEEILKPFADPQVHSVAGLVLPLNNRHRWTRSGSRIPRLSLIGRDILCRTQDVWFTTAQLIDRAAQSVTGSVLVNSGPLAALRGSVVRDNLAGYVDERFFGRQIHISDDSQLTLYALVKGKAVQQTSAVAFTLMPETFSHHRRQFMRWTRGSFMRSWWRFRYLPLRSFAFWSHFVSYVNLVVSTVLVAVLFVVVPARTGQWVAAWPALLLVPMAVGVGQAAGHLTVARSDQSLWSQLGTMALSPLAAVYSFTGLRLMRLWGMVTPLRGGWGTRQSVEVTMPGSDR